jgi:hypothetical protein
VFDTSRLLFTLLRLYLQCQTWIPFLLQENCEGLEESLPTSYFQTHFVVFKGIRPSLLSSIPSFYFFLVILVLESSQSRQSVLVVSETAAAGLTITFFLFSMETLKRNFTVVNCTKRNVSLKQLL